MSDSLLIATDLAFQMQKNKVDRLMQENARLKQQVEDHQHQEQLMEMVIERRDEHIKTLREALEEIADIVALYKDGRETAVYEIAKAALGESDG